MSLMFIIYVLLVVMLFCLSGYLAFFCIKRIFLNSNERKNISNIIGIYSFLLACIPFIGGLYFAPKYMIRKFHEVKIITTLKGIGIYLCFFIITSILCTVSRDIIIKPLISGFQINGSAMYPTFIDKSFHAVVTFNKTINRGDSIMYRDGSGLSRLSRIIGLPNEVIEINNGIVYLVNSTGEKQVLNEPYLPSGTKTLILGNLGKSEFHIPPNSFFVMGDNRDNSSDSRSCFYKGCNEIHNNKFLDINDIIGKLY